MPARAIVANSSPPPYSMVACPTCIGGCAHYPPPTPQLRPIPLPSVSNYYGSRVAGMSSTSYYPYHNVIASGAPETSSVHSSPRMNRSSTYPSRTPSVLSSRSSLSSLSSAHIPSTPSSTYSSGSSSLRLHPFLVRPTMPIDLTQLPHDLPERLLSQVDLRAPATHPPVRQLSLSIDIPHPTSTSSQLLHSTTILIERSEGVRCIDVLRRAAEYITLSKFSEKESQAIAVTLLATATAPAPGAEGAGQRETQLIRVPRRPVDLLRRGSIFTGINQTSRQSASDEKPSYRMQLRS